MLQKIEQVNHAYAGPAPTGARELEAKGHFLLRGEFSPGEIARLRDEILEVYGRCPPDPRAGRTSPENAEMFRYQMFNRSALCQEAIARAATLAILEPLLGQDCHVVSCTAWRNPPGNRSAPYGQEWHVDGGVHVPRPEGTEWPVGIPYPIFVIATHVYLQDCHLADGPTAFLEGSHMSGRIPPRERRFDLDLDYRGRTGVAHIAKAGDVGFFVSDVWHRRLPPAPDATGRFFLQTNYGRREIAQRVLPTDEVNHTTPDSRARARTERQRQLLGLHPQCFYDG